VSLLDFSTEAWKKSCHRHLTEINSAVEHSKVMHSANPDSEHCKFYLAGAATVAVSHFGMI
jgi:hypothetical protein